MSIYVVAHKDFPALRFDLYRVIGPFRRVMSP